MTSYVDLVREEENRTIVLARALWDGHRSVRMEGDFELCQMLLAGFPDGTGEMCLPSDGERFLRALTEVYRNPYLFATAIQKGEAPATTFG